MVAKQQKGAIHSDEIISSFKYSDEVMKENNVEFEKVKKASSSHYAFVRAEREAFLVEQQNDNNEQPEEKEVIQNDSEETETETTETEEYKVESEENN